LSKARNDCHQQRSFVFSFSSHIGTGPRMPRPLPPMHPLFSAGGQCIQNWVSVLKFSTIPYTTLFARLTKGKILTILHLFLLNPELRTLFFRFLSLNSSQAAKRCWCLCPPPRHDPPCGLCSPHFLLFPLPGSLTPSRRADRGPRSFHGGPPLSRPFLSPLWCGNLFFPPTLPCGLWRVLFARVSRPTPNVLVPHPLLQTQRMIPLTPLLVPPPAPPWTFLPPFSFLHISFRARDS